jgi:lipase maturation factor
MTDGLAGFWYTRFTFERGLALIYLVAFLVAANQFVPLLGEHGLLPVPRFVRQVPFPASPSLFYLLPTDRAFGAAAWAGVALSILALVGYPQRRGAMAAAAVWALLWALYLSFVNVGQTFYAFGWETLLLETGFLAIFAGGSATEPSTILMWLWRWVLFRVMFGAGLIKLRGDPCWHNLTCLDYYFETQPIPNPLSWYFHWLPPLAHRAGVAFNHVAELVVPFGYFAPQPICGIAGVVTILFQLGLIASGNLSWLNWLTLVLAIPTLDDRWLSWLPIAPPVVQPEHAAHRIAVYALAAVVAALSIGPVLNMLSPGQLMNSSFEPLHLVNTYGAFGSITRTRYEIVIEGTDDPSPTDAAIWREYEFKGKPGDVLRRPPQIAPYHLRLDWLMWFAAMSSPYEHTWFEPLLVRLLEGDRATLALLETDPFPDHPPRFVRALYYWYRFTTPEERKQTGAWWHRERKGVYYPIVASR